MKIKPLRRSITTATIIFAVLLVAAVAFSTYQLFTNAMFDRYEKQMESIVSFVQSNIDNDDLAECAKTYKESKKHKKLQRGVKWLTFYHSQTSLHGKVGKQDFRTLRSGGCIRNPDKYAELIYKAIPLKTRLIVY